MEEKFNKWFNAFILIGMTVAIVLTTIIKFDASDSGHTGLLIAAFGSLMGILSVVLSANGRILTFLFGLLDVLSFDPLFLGILVSFVIMAMGILAKRRQTL